MTDTSVTEDVRHNIAQLARQDGGRLLSLLIGRFRRFDLAEEALQEALASALVHWQRNGLPGNPQGWLLAVARRKAIDRLRRDASWQRQQDELDYLLSLESGEDMVLEHFPDERLKLIFTCCHPALERSTGVALTLRSLCGLSTEEIAHAFLISKEAMAQRLVRGQQKITRAGIPFAVPEPEQFGARLAAVLAVIYLIFNEGYSAARPEGLRVDLCAEAQRLAGLLGDLLPEAAEVAGLSALMRFHAARFATRLDAEGLPQPLDQQDRSLWDHAEIEAASQLLQRTLRRGQAGPYQLQAAIAAIHAEAKSWEDTDWREIVLIYNRMVELSPNPVVVLNRQVALSYAAGPAVALEGLAAVADDLADYQPFHAARADFLLRLDRRAEARLACETAIRLSRHEGERRLMERKLAQFST